VICSGYPTQLALATTFTGLGFGVFRPNGELSLTYVMLVSLTDTALLLGLIAIFLAVHRERPRDVFVGARAIGAEALAGVPMVFGALVIGIATLLAIRAIAPWLQTAPENPFQGLIRTRTDLAMFVALVFVAGGVREEIQRAFLLRRFERWLGGAPIGVVITSVAFGNGHRIQGLDAAVATGALGAFWALVYLRRRSIVAPLVSHTGFDLLQLALLLTVRR
jgi:membrane protease YdiL (CAAX protease family)